MNQPTEIHKRIVNALFRGLRNLEILDELSDPRGLSLTLGDADEREMENQINRLRKERAEAQACALEAATEAFRQGKSWQQVIAILERPYLLTSGEVTSFASKARAVVEAEQEGAA